MLNRCLVFGSLTSAFLAFAPAAMASTGTVFWCKVDGESEVQVLMDAEGKTIAVEQDGKTSHHTHAREGRFRIDFQGGTFEFVMSKNDHAGMLTITRSNTARTGMCS